MLSKIAKFRKTEREIELVSNNVGKAYPQKPSKFASSKNFLKINQKKQIYCKVF